jgi:endonuclease/exonuclease/phosphatase family metal-dependent hydrolase
MPRFIFAFALAILILTTSFAAEPTPEIRVMSYNIRYGTARDGVNHWSKRKDFLVDTIKKYDPDLLGTQETLADQRDYLAKALPGYGLLAAGRDDGKEKGEMAALYWREARFEKTDGGHFWLSETPDKVGSRGWDAALPRIVTWVKLKDRKAPDAKPLLYLNTHFDHKGVKARLESAKLIREKMAKLGEGCDVILTGDFNAAEGSAPYKALFADASPLVDTFRVAHPTPSKEEGTFSGFKADATRGARIDWIGVSSVWKVLGAGIDRTAKDGRTPSDHFAVTAEVRR